MTTIKKVNLDGEEFDLEGLQHPATKETLGSVIIGEGINVTEDGVISVDDIPNEFVGAMDDGVIPIALGGTGATSAATARQAINHLGTNPIASLEEDTIENWKALGTGVAWVSGTGILNGQKTTSGFLYNVVRGNYVFQTWYGMNASSPVWYRSGNESGWYAKSANWVQSLDEKTGIQKKLVWTNESPSSNFASQNITVDLSEYDEIEVEFRANTTSSYYYCCNFTKGKASRCATLAQQTSDGENTYILDRTVTMNNDNVFFGGGGQKIIDTQVYTSNTSRLIPIRIWAIKGVQ